MPIDRGHPYASEATKWLVAVMLSGLLILISVFFLMSIPRPVEEFDTVITQDTYGGRPLWCRQGKASLNWSVGNPIIASKDNAMLCREFERELLYFYKVPEDDRRICRVIDGEIFCYYEAKGVD